MRKTIVVAVVFVAAVLTHVRGSQASGGFSVRSLRGVYGFSGTGTLGGGTIPAAVVGFNYFDRAGGCEIRARLNTGTRIDPTGAVQVLNSTSCTYSVEPDGSGSLDVMFEPPFAAPFHSDFVIVDGARELQFVLSDPFGATVASGTSTQQSGGK
jgi:hypothetical protein